MKRLQSLFIFFVVLIIAIIIKLFYIQTIDSERFSSNNYLQTQRIIPSRGNIVDTNNEPLVINQASYLMFAEPKNIKDADEIIEKIDKILEIGEATLEARLDTTKQWIPLAYDIDEENKKAITELDLAGLGFEEHSKRFYPEASIAAHLIGFVGKDDEGDSIGYFGVEGFYHKDLEGLPGILKTERDIVGKPIVIGTQDRLRGENGRDLVLTIDKSIQMMVKRRLNDALELYKAESGCITVMNPHTGEVLALSCLPDFDPVEYYKFTEENYRNPTISDVFEPGSIFKPLIVAAALNEEKIKPSDTYIETGPIKIGKYNIRTWNDKYNGRLTISEILQNSSNVGMVYIGGKLGEENILKYLDAYGIGRKTGIDLQGEVSGRLKPKTQWYPIEYATVTFGQGIALTQIQMITAFSSLINGGWIMKPHVVKQMISESGDVKEIKPKKIRQVISAKTSKIIKEMLVDTVEHGEVNWDIPEGYKIGGKTGTAQIALEGAYDASKTNASFIGFAPADKPEFIALVTLHKPTTSPWASETSAPVFFDVARDLLVCYNIAPE